MPFVIKLFSDDQGECGYLETKGELFHTKTELRYVDKKDDATRFSRHQVIAAVALLLERQKHHRIELHSTEGIPHAVE